MNQLGFVSKMNSAHIRRVIAAGMIGNALEWYDFAIYGYFAVQIGRHFFPHGDAVAQLLSAFGVFAIGYLMRPIGGVLVGHIGDRFGRRTALVFSVTAMASPTVAASAGRSSSSASTMPRGRFQPDPPQRNETKQYRLRPSRNCLLS